MKGERILVCDPSVQAQRALRVVLREAGYEVVTTATGPAALGAVARERPQAVILELALPDRDGIEVCRRLRRNLDAPILVLSEIADDETKVAAFTCGADDYLTKPFGIEELLARIRVALRHAAQAQTQSRSTIIHAGGLEINLAERTVKRGDEEIKLTATEFKLLAYLAAHADRVLTHQAILSQVWDPVDADHVEYLRVYMRQLRKKLEDDPDQPQFLITEPGVGYRLLADE